MSSGLPVTGAGVLGPLQVFTCPGQGFPTSLLIKKEITWIYQIRVLGEQPRSHPFESHRSSLPRCSCPHGIVQMCAGDPDDSLRQLLRPLTSCLLVSSRPRRVTQCSVPSPAGVEKTEHFLQDNFFSLSPSFLPCLEPPSHFFLPRAS